MVECVKQGRKERYRAQKRYRRAIVMAENSRSEQEKMEEMIRKYKEEAMRYQERGSTLYREQIPAREVSAAPADDPSSRVTWREAPEPSEPTAVTPDPPAEPTAASEPVPDDLQGAGDVRYAPEPLSPEQIAEESGFTPATVPYTDEGELQVEVSAAIRSLPIELADILVLRIVKGEQELIRYLQTNSSGNSPIITLPAPPRELSGQPEPSGLRPYGVYTVTVSHPEYYTTIIRDVQIFAGQRALLPVNLIPLSEKLTNPSAPNFNITTDSHGLNESGT